MLQAGRYSIDPPKSLVITKIAFKTLDDVFEAAEKIRDAFHKVINHIAKASGLSAKVAPTKTRERAEEKERDSLDAQQVKSGDLDGPACAWIFDIERATLILSANRLYPFSDYDMCFFVGGAVRE